MLALRLGCQIVDDYLIERFVVIDISRGGVDRFNRLRGQRSGRTRWRKLGGVGRLIEAPAFDGRDHGPMLLLYQAADPFFVDTRLRLFRVRGLFRSQNLSAD